MHVTFYGAVREVTGSMHLITTGDDRILLDCGLFQGRRKQTAEKNRVLPFEAGILTNTVLSHAHIDHSGRIPMLTQNGFSGRIFCTRPTHSACGYLLADSASIQESDANYLNYKTLRHALSQPESRSRTKKTPDRHMNAIKKLLKKGRHDLNVETINEMMAKLRLEAVQPLYTMEDAQRALAHFDGYPYEHRISIGKEMTCTFYDAGHILGSAISIITARENGRTFRVCFSGDLGRFQNPILKDPTLAFADDERDVDLMIMESTYGNRLHEPVGDLKAQLRGVLEKTFARGGTVLIPAFALGRTQTLLYMLHELYDEKEIPAAPIYVDSPLATHLTQVFGEHPEVYDKEAKENFLEKGKNPFYFSKINFVGSVEESMALNRQERPQIVIAASGMCEAGRILHHLRFKIHNEKNTILLVGYMAQNTLGRRIEEAGLAYEQSGRKGDPPVMRFFNKYYPLKAHVAKIGGFSAHADKAEMLRFLSQSNLRINRIALVHGEEEQALPFAEELGRQGYRVVVPRKGESLQVG